MWLPSCSNLGHMAGGVKGQKWAKDEQVGQGEWGENSATPRNAVVGPFSAGTGGPLPAHRDPYGTSGVKVHDWELLSDSSGPVPSLHSQDNRCRRGHLRIPGGCRPVRECLRRVFKFQVMTYSSEPGVAHPSTAGRPAAFLWETPMQGQG